MEQRYCRPLTGRRLDWEEYVYGNVETSRSERFYLGTMGDQEHKERFDNEFYFPE